MNEVWSRVSEGRHVVLVGNPPPPPEVVDGEPRWAVVQIGCDGPSSTWGPLEAARRRIEGLLGEQSPRWDEALDRMGSSSARLLGDLPEPTVEAMFVGAANRLAARRPQRAALVLDGLEAADDATLQALRDIVTRAGWLRLPLVLTVRQVPTQGRIAELLEALGEPPVVLEASVEPAAFEWSSLGSELLLVMRAAAVVGRSFDIELVGRLLGVSADAVLLRLQQVADLGAPLADHGDGRFFIPEAAQQVLVQRVLPSLVERWHRRLGEILAEPMAESMPPVAEADVDEPRAQVPAPSSPRSPAVEDRGDAPAVVVADETEPEGPITTYGEVFEPPAGEGLSSSSPVAPTTDALDERSVPSSVTDRAAAPRFDLEDRGPQEPVRPAGAAARDQARAAHHLSEAGLSERAIEQYLAALRKVAARGDGRRALLIADQALALLDRQPPSRARDLLHARVLSMAARVQWRGAGRGPALTLHGALETLDQAVQLIGPEGPLVLRTEVAQLVASVCYDLGDIASLQRALDALTEAARGLMDAGESVLAARLLNDQAAVYLRAGDPVRANHLLQQSRRVFDSLHRERPDDPTVIVERAETEHLLARLPLHARLRPGREDDAFSLALGHARAAAEGYGRLDNRVELGRVAETMGRLETARGRHEHAAAHIDASLRTCRQLGDVIGLARSTAALAELYSAAGRPAEALAALHDSVTFNVDKGSPYGLAVNRRTLASLRQAIAADPRRAPALAPEVREIEDALAGAEAMLGRVSVPGDRD